METTIKEKIEAAIKILEMQEQPIKNIRSAFMYLGVRENAVPSEVNIVANMRTDALSKLREVLSAIK